MVEGVAAGGKKVAVLLAVEQMTHRVWQMLCWKNVDKIPLSRNHLDIVQSQRYSVEQQWLTCVWWSQHVTLHLD